VLKNDSAKPLSILVNSYWFDFLFIYGWYLVVQQFKEAGIIMQTQPMFRNGTAANKYSFTGYFGGKL
jgi:hypothetical protein